tara:strand:- start:1051 stop:1827 length:777 start_codon:yes stop_codon:yes gene_type:complete
MGKHRQFVVKGRPDLFIGGEYDPSAYLEPMNRVNGFKLTMTWLEEDYTYEIEKRYNIKLPFFPKREGKNLTHELKLIARHYISYCWACGTGRSKHRPFERAHVLPKSKCKSERYYDGDHNKVLLCKQCHKDSPDTTNIGFFYHWISQKEPYLKSLIEGVRSALACEYSMEQFKQFFLEESINLEPRNIRKQVEVLGFEDGEGALELTKYHGYNHASRVSFIFDLFNRIHNPNYNHDWHYEGNRVDKDYTLRKFEDDEN